MSTSNLYSLDFPDKYKVTDIDIPTLYHSNRFREIDDVIICRDKKGKVTATFGQSNWNCLPFSRKKAKNTFKMAEFDVAPHLQRELKLFVYCWLFNKSPKKRKALSFSGVYSRLDSLKIAYRFLLKHNHLSLKALSSSSVWSEFKIYLREKDYSPKTIEHIFVAINAAINDSSWHKIILGFRAPIKTKEESTQIANKVPQQTLVIPERLCNEIYGKAIELIESAHPHKELIAETEKALQENYLKGRRIVDKKVKRGVKFSFMRRDGSINNHKYASAINDNQPKDPITIISPLAKNLPKIPLNDSNSFRKYLGQLFTSSFIVCGGFTGMRESELDKLTPDSYYMDRFSGRDYHMLQSHTFKLGERQETWVTAASSKVAIELMSSLTKYWRPHVVYPSRKYQNTIWVNQPYRSRPPSLISSWNARLNNFVQDFSFIVTTQDFKECLENNPCSQNKVIEKVIVGEPWPISTHQFRRTLAFYCVKNRLSTLVALKQQFKHLYMAMTEWYTNGGQLASLHNLKVDTKIQQALEEVNAETTANKIFKQWHSDETLSGTHGKAIMKMRGDVPTIYSSWDVIYKAVKDGKLTLHGSMHSYCKSGYDCDMNGVVAPQFCVDCGSGSSIIDKQQAKWWQRKHRSLVAYIESGGEISVSEHSHYVTQVRAAEKVMADFDMPFTPFEPDLKVASL
ncbi:hypothetical protein [Vibrio astriarenae]|uniref:hypothetical protein n=1 Tax=Vibrio astriarenae TaxID=1481923 RepID=UPI003736D93E